MKGRAPCSGSLEPALHCCLPYLHFRMTMKDIQLNCYKIRALTGETKNLKEKMFDIETLANDIDLRIKEAIEREVLFG